MLKRIKFQLGKNVLYADCVNKVIVCIYYYPHDDKSKNKIIVSRWNESINNPVFIADMKSFGYTLSESGWIINPESKSKKYRYA